MGTCAKCGNNKLFLKIDKATGLCPSCYALAEEKRKKLENEAVTLLKDLKRVAELANKATHFYSFLQYYDRAIGYLKRACEIEDEIDHFEIIKGNFHKDYENNMSRQQLSYQDALRREYDDISQNKNTYTPQQLVNRVRIFRIIAFGNPESVKFLSLKSSKIPVASAI